MSIERTMLGFGSGCCAVGVRIVNVHVKEGASIDTSIVDREGVTDAWIDACYLAHDFWHIGNLNHGTLDRKIDIGIVACIDLGLLSPSTKSLSL